MAFTAIIGSYFERLLVTQLIVFLKLMFLILKNADKLSLLL